MVDSVVSSRCTQLAGTDEAEVVRRQRREETHPDVRRRRAVGDRRHGRFLEVVGGQAVIHGTHERLEIAPGPARDETEEASVLGSEVMTLWYHGPTEPVGHQRRGDPHGQQRPRHREAARPGRDDAAEQDERDDGAGRHLCEEQQRACPRAQPRGPGGGGRGRFPLEEAALGQDEANERERDGMHHLVGVVGEERDLQQRLGDGRLHVVAENPEEHAQGLLRPRTDAEPDGQRI